MIILIETKFISNKYLHVAFVFLHWRIEHLPGRGLSYLGELGGGLVLDLRKLLKTEFAEATAHLPAGGRCKATWKRDSKLPWREASSLDHHDDIVDSDQ